MVAEEVGSPLLWESLNRSTTKHRFIFSMAAWVIVWNSVELRRFLLMSCIWLMPSKEGISMPTSALLQDVCSVAKR